MVSTRSGNSRRSDPQSPPRKHGQGRKSQTQHLVDDDSNDDDTEFLTLKKQPEFDYQRETHNKSLFGDSPTVQRPTRHRRNARIINDEEEYFSKVESDERLHHRSLIRLGLEDEGSSCEEDGIGSLATRARTSSRDKGFPSMLLHRGRKGEPPKERNDINYQERSKQNSSPVKPELRNLLIAQGKDPANILNQSQPDIYSTIKSRHRHRRPRVFYGEYEFASTTNGRRGGDDPDTTVEDNDGEDDVKDQDPIEEEGIDEDEEEGEDENGVPYRRYSLRTKRAQPHRLNYELVQHTRRPARTMFDQLPRSPVRRKRVFAVDQNNPTSPYQRRHLRTNSQGASSSGSTSQSDDEKKFDRRKSRSMAKARNKCLPMNLSASELATHGFARERVKIGSSLADVDPMTLDKSVKFSSIGGHKHHIRSLKEMVVFPLIYPEIFTRFNIAPPRGCLFHGPPGTGKTLMARALVNECSTDSRKVAFFMRKGADCLSKWVGESERQLRLLFDQAYQMRPSIIFFDEIDGLAPVRSSRQDQIHSSIVSTLLALMDGLDSRGEIVVIGATNRIDFIDPALRRPGRFDREFLFPLPDKKSRHEILKIHTAKWEPPLPQPFVENLAEKTVGYCGADLKALCTEATLHALRKSFPQIYATNDKLKLDVNQISIGPNNFYQAMKSIVPTAQRSHPTPAYPLSPSMVPLLQATLIRSIAQLARVFPITLKKSKLLKSRGEIPSPDENADSDSDDDDEADTVQNATSLPPNGLSTLTSNAQSYRESVIHRPRLMICGADKAGHTTHLAPAILHDIEGLPLHLMNIASLFSISACTPEESCSQVFREAIRTAPCIIYLPDITTWWNCASDTLRYTFQSHLQSVPTSSPVLVIATSNEPHMLLPHPLSTIFNPQYNEVFNVSKPSTEERTLFFAPIFNKFAVKPPVQKDLHKKSLPSLERAPPPPVVELTEAELKNLELSEESTMRSLRLFLRDVLTRLAQDRRFKVFLKPVDLEEVEDYADVIENPMDISTMMNRIDQHKYQNVASFLSDINLICSNALEYNPDFCAEDKSLRHRACLLKDMAHAIVEEDLDPNFERKCNEVIDAQQRRKANPSKFAPSYYNVLPKNKKAPTQQLEGVMESGKPHNGKAVPPRNPTVKRKSRRKSSWACGKVKKRKKPKMIVGHQEQEEKEEGEEKKEGEEKGEEQEEKGEEQEEEQEENKEEMNGIIYSEGEINDQNSDEGSNENGVNRDTHSPVVENPPFENAIEGEFPDISEKGSEELSNNSEKSLLSNNNSDKDGSDRSTPTNPTEQSEDEDLSEDEPPPVCIVEGVEDSGLDHEHEVESDQEDQNEMKEINFEDENMKAVEPNVRVRTRSMGSQPPAEPLVVDPYKLKRLLEYTVQVTSKLMVADLERLYSILSRSIYRHRHDYDKTQLTQDLQDDVCRFVSSVSGE